MARTAISDPDDEGPAILQTTWILTAMAIITTFLRVYVRIKITNGLSAHDWFMIVAMLLQIGSQACITESYRWGLGMHDQYLTQDPAMPWIQMLKWVYISTIPGVLCSIVARISICLLLISLFGTKLWLKWWLIVTTALVSVVGVVSITLTWCQSDPVEGLWNPLIPARRWDNMISVGFVFASGSIWALTDLTYVLFPVLIIWKLNAPLRRKLGLCVLLAGSLFSVATCVMRIITAHQGSLHDSATGMLWASVEQSLVVILGSVPTLAAIRKLNTGFLHSFGTSLASLVDIMGSRKQSSRGTGSKSERSSTEGMVQLSSREV